MQLAPNRMIPAISQPGSTIYDSLDAKGFPAQPRLVIMPLSVMISASWETDAHFVTYQIEGIEDPDSSYRVKKEAVEGLEAIGHRVVTTAVGIDLDLKDMGFDKDASWNDLDADTASDLYANVRSLAFKVGGVLAPFTALYTGLRGFKLIHQLSEPIPVSAAEALILKFLNAYTTAGLPVDMKCKDWTRLFRAPRVIREDGIVTQDQSWFKLEFVPDNVYQVTDADKAARPMPKYKPLVPIGGSAPAPDEAESLVWEFSEKGRKWTPLAAKAEKLLRNTVLHAHVFGGTPLHLHGNRHGALVTLVGGLCKVFAPHPEFTPEFVAALAMEATKLLEQDEDWRGKVWEQVTTFLTRDRARVPELPTILTKPAPSLPMPSGGEDDDELQVVNNLPPQIPPEPVGMPAFSQNPENGQIYPTRRNFALALEHSRIVFWRDEFTGRDMILTPLQSQEITDDMELCVRMHLEDTYGIGIKSPEKWHEFVTWSAIKNAHHPARYYFDSLQWDGKPRLKGLFYDYFGSPPSLPPELSEQFATLIMVAAVRRIRYPGVKFDEVVVLEGDQGTWKCLGRGTKVIMFDGSTKAVEDVRLGDQLMGPDSTPRKVLDLSRGVGPLRRIMPTKGDSWVCNDNHILTVALHGEEGYHDSRVTDFVPHKWGSRHAPSNKYAMQVRAETIQFPKKEVFVDPYLMGLWLGDGTVGKPEITNTEPEVHEYCELVAAAHGVEYRLKRTNGCPQVGMAGMPSIPGQFQHYHRGNPNPLLQVLKTCVVDGEKRILRDYLVNDEKSRLQLLAGLIDSDGHLDCGTFAITTKWAGLRDDILFLARSLGFAAYSHEHMHGIKTTGFKARYHDITISGDLDRVPVKVQRKKATSRKQAKSVLRTGFEVKDEGVGEFFGFTLDGDSRFLLADFTITHNSSALRALCPRPEWFCDDVSLDTDSKTLIEQTRGKLFVELAELSGGKKAQIDKMKAMLSRQTDRARAAYARRAEDIPRQFVFWASTNDAKYLRDHTGNRRFWPVPVTKIDMKSLERDRDQLWAEAAVLESRGLSIRLDPKLYVPAAQLASQRTTEDVFVQALAHHIAEFEAEPNIAIRSNDVWNMLGVERINDRHALSSRFGEACKSLGFRGEQITRNGVRVLHRVRGEADPRVLKFLKWNKQAEKLILDRQNVTASVSVRQPNVVLEE